MDDADDTDPRGFSFGSIRAERPRHSAWADHPRSMKFLHIVQKLNFLDTNNSIPS